MSTSTPDTGYGGPEGHEILDEPIKLAIFDISHSTVDMARDWADRRAAEASTDRSLGRFRGTLKKIWHNEFERFYREKNKHEALDAMREAGSIYAKEGGTAGLSDEEAVKATIARVTSDIEGAVNENAGERRTLIDSTSEGKELKDGIFDMVEHAIDNGLSREDFEEFAKRHIRQLSDQNPNMFGEGVMYAHNLWDVKEAVELARDHGAGLDRIREEAQLHVGEARMGVHTEARRDTVDRLLDKVNDKELNLGILGVVKASTIAVTAAATVGAVKGVAQKGVGAAAAATGAIGLFAGARGWYKERRRLNIERSQDMREHAMGKVDEFADPEAIDASTRKGRRQKRLLEKSIQRRQEIAATRYDTLSATEQADALLGYLDPESGELRIHSEDEYNEALEQLALAKVADQISSTRGIDLVRYSSVETVDHERWELLLARATLAARLEEKFSEFYPDDTYGPDMSNNFDLMLSAHMASFETLIHEDIEKKDEMFNTLRRWKSVRAGGMSAGIGLLVGASLQELAGHAQDGSDFPLTGEVDSLGEMTDSDLGDHDTFLQGVYEQLDINPGGDGKSIEDMVDTPSGGDGEGLLDATDTDGTTTDARDAMSGLPDDVEPSRFATQPLDENGIEIPREETPLNDYSWETPGASTEGVPEAVLPSELTLLEPNPDTATTTFTIGEYTHLNLPSGFRVDEHVEHGLHSYTIQAEVDGSETTLAVIYLDENGQITESSLSALESLGVSDVSTPAFSETLSGEFQQPSMIGERTEIVLPAEYSVEPGEGGIQSIVNSNGEKIGEITLDNNGVITNIEGLELEGADIDVTTYTVDGDPEQVLVSPEEYLASHETTSVSRDLWYGGDTQVADRWELQLHAGGENDSWFDSEGNVIVDVSGMLESDVFQGGESANVAQLIQEGNLKAAVSLGEGSQSEVFMFDIQINESGRATAVIDSSDGVSSLFGQTEGGERLFQGGYIEILEMTGEQSESGAESVRVLSTFVGQNNAGSIAETVPTVQEVSRLTISPDVESFENHEITFGEIDTSALEDAAEDATEDALDDAAGATEDGVETGTDATDTDLEDEAAVDVNEVADQGDVIENEINPIISHPIYARTGMESLKYKRPAERLRREGYYYGGGYSPEAARERSLDASPRLRTDPETTLRTSEETDYYRALLERRRGLGYVETVYDTIDSSETLSQIGTNIEAIVTIPAQAVSEAENLYGLLSMYAQQGGDVLDKTVLLLHLNWTSANMANPEERAKVELARREIERARAAYPDLQLAVIEKQLPDKLIEEGNGVIGEIAREMYDTAILSIDRAIKDGRMDADHDVLMIRSDADIKGMDARFIRRHLDTAASNPESDAFVGAVRWDTSLARKFPGYTISTHFYNAAIAYLGRKQAGRSGPATGGTNSSVRISSLAAVGSIGFGEYKGAGSDDVEIGRRLKDARSGRSVVGDSSPYGEVRSHYSPKSRSGRGKNVRTPVVGAHVDSSGDRIFTSYIRGSGISNTWAAFNEGEGGYSEDFVDPDTVRPEIVDGEVENIAVVAQRIEFNISELCSRWFTDDASVQTVLTLMFGMPGDEKNYTYERSGGKARFKFTDSGKAWLKERIEKDAAGSPNPYGSRIRGKLYGEPDESGRTPTNRSTPRFVQAE